MSTVVPGTVAMARRPWDGFVEDVRQAAREPVTLAAATALALLLILFVLFPIGLAVPGTAMGLGYILLFNTPPLVLTGSLLILILNTAFRELSVGMEAGISKLHQLDPSIEEASRALGAGLLATFRRVVVSLMGSAFVAGFVYTLMVGMITVSAVVFLIAPGMNLAAVYILNLAETGAIGLACALAVVLIAIVLACLGLLKVIAQRTGLVLGGA